jgi:hypothetical protein
MRMESRKCHIVDRRPWVPCQGSGCAMGIKHSNPFFVSNKQALNRSSMPLVDRSSFSRSDFARYNRMADELEELYKS